MKTYLARLLVFNVERLFNPDSIISNTKARIKECY